MVFIIATRLLSSLTGGGQGTKPGQGGVEEGTKERQMKIFLPPDQARQGRARGKRVALWVSRRGRPWLSPLVTVLVDFSPLFGF